MRLPDPLLALVALITTTTTASPYLHPPPSPQHLLADTSDQTPLTIPTRYESTVLARRMLAKLGTGVLTTSFPANISSPYIPHSVATLPVGLPDYIASCEEPSGNPTILALTISTSTRNVYAGSNASLTLSWWDEYTKLTGKQPWSTANLPRLSLIGYMVEIPMKEAVEAGIPECFTGVHADAEWWLPGKTGAAHQGLWMRLVVEQVYWIGGFGDRAFIGWFEPAEWRNVTVKEWEGVRLPGEKA